jgi:heat shock protein HtpX
MLANPLVSHKLNNVVHAVLLLGGMVGLLMLVGWMVAGGPGLFWMAVLGVFMVGVTPRLSPALILRMYRARRLVPGELPGLENLVARLSQQAGLAAPPALFYIPSPLMNAFSVGGGKEAAIAVTDGLLRGLNSRELLGVMAHEVSHIRHNDMWLMSLADAMSRVVGGFSFFGQVLFFINLPLLLISGQSMPWLPILLLILAPSLSALLQLALSRNREFDADLGAARLTGDPLGLAQALEKLEVSQEVLWHHFLIPGRRNRQPSLLRTHPHSEQRIARLKALVPEAAAQAIAELPPFLVPSDWQVPNRRPRHRWHGLWY